MRFFDLHCDTPYECYKNSLPFDNSILAVTPEKGKEFCEWKQCFAVWIKDDLTAPFEFYKSVISEFKQKLKNKPKNLSSVFTVEGGAVIENDIGRISLLKNDGIRAVTLTWNGKNRIASGTLSQGGLTDFGVNVIKEMNRLSLACDVSHLNQESFWDVIKIAEFPYASHSCCSSICSHSRNLTDAQIKAITEKGGVIGICAYPVFLGEGDVFEQLYRHLYHLLDLGLENYIAFGSDFDGADMAYKLSDISQIPDLCDFLVKKGIENKIISKFFYKNAMNFFTRL